MFSNLAEGYRKLRYLPRFIVGRLDLIAGDLASLRLKREATLAAAAAELRDAHGDLASLCDETTKAVRGLQSDRNGVSPRVALMERRMKIMEESMRAVVSLLDEIRDTVAGNPRPDAGDVRSLLERQSARIEHLSSVIAEHARIYPSWVWKPDDGVRARAALAKLRPVLVPGVNKLRVGRDRDGGYVMLDDFAAIDAAISVGIGNDDSWDRQIADQGIKVLQFDPTIAAAPTRHPMMSFEPIRLTRQDGPGGVSLDTIIQTRLASASGPLLLKIDIEGDEWAVFRGIPERALSRFKQIVCEFHNLERLGDNAFGEVAGEVFGRLARSHFVHHVHGNNCGNFVNVGNVVVPQSLEVSFGLRDAYETAEGDAVFPTALDRPNEPGRADLYLGPFRFDDREAEAPAHDAVPVRRAVAGQKRPFTLMSVPPS